MRSFDWVSALLAQTQLDPLGDTDRLSNLLQKGGLAAVAAIFIVASVFLFRSRENLQAAKDAEVRELTKQINDLHVVQQKALLDAADRARTNEEAKNGQLIGFVGKFTEVTAANTAALERLTEVVQDLKRGS